jgi:hypothetical protein
VPTYTKEQATNKIQKLDTQIKELENRPPTAYTRNAITDNKRTIKFYEYVLARIGNKDKVAIPQTVVIQKLYNTKPDNQGII